MERERKTHQSISKLSSRPAQKLAKSTKGDENPKAQSKVRPIRFLLYANLQEAPQKLYRIHAQRFWVRFGII